MNFLVNLGNASITVAILGAIIFSVFAPIFIGFFVAERIDLSYRLHEVFHKIHPFFCGLLAAILCMILELAVAMTIADFIKK